MPMFRTYETDSGLVAITATGLTAPLLFLSTPATADGNLFKIKCSVEAGAGAPVVPTNSNAFFSVNVVTGTKAGGAAVTPNPTGPVTLASNITASSGSTAITGLTQSTELWGGTCSLVPGSSTSDDDPNTGEEVYLKISGQWAVYANIPAGPGAPTVSLRVIIWHAE